MGTNVLAVVYVDRKSLLKCNLVVTIFNFSWSTKNHSVVYLKYALYIVVITSHLLMKFKLCFKINLIQNSQAVKKQP